MSDKKIIFESKETQLQYQLLESIDSINQDDSVHRWIASQKKALLREDEKDLSPLVAFGLGMGVMFGLLLTQISSMFTFGLYISFLCLYNFLEYVFVWKFHPSEAGLESFLIFHSKEYGFALGVSFLEYAIEYFLFPSMKEYRIFLVIGAIGTVFGQVCRTTAQWTAGANFHHQIREQKEEGHVLVTSGIYQYSRHPSYMGWFWWSVSTQILLSNPISFALFTYMSWKFFEDRIKFEEQKLIKIFKDDYIKFKQQVGVGIPFIK